MIQKSTVKRINRTKPGQLGDLLVGERLSGDNQLFGFTNTVKINMRREIPVIHAVYKPGNIRTVGP